MDIQALLAGKTIAKAEEFREDGELKAIQLTFTDGSEFRVNGACMYHETEGYPFGYLAMSHLGARNDG